MARAIERKHEIAIRRALGATRAQIFSQFLTESMLVSFLGGLIGLLIAPGCVRLLSLLSTDLLPVPQNFSLNSHVLFFTFGVSLIAGAFLGMVAYWQTIRTDLQNELKTAGKGVVSAGSHRLKKALVVSQVALSLAMITAAILLLKSFYLLLHVNPGFQKENLLLMRLSLPLDRYSSGQALALYSQEISHRLKGIAEIQSSAEVSILPLSAMNTRTDFTIDGRPPKDPADIPAAQNRWASPGYFQTMKIPILQGREFSDHDTAENPAVVVIDEALANRFFPEENPIGKRIQIIQDSSADAKSAEIIGIAGTVKQDRLEEDPVPTLYAPISQIKTGSIRFFVGRVMLVIRTAGEPKLAAEAVRREIISIDRDVAISSVRTMEQFVQSTLGPRLFSMILIGIFASVALLLAATGVYGIVAYSVEQRKM
jgi:predicted permease